VVEEVAAREGEAGWEVVVVVTVVGAAGCSCTDSRSR
jgi:hypothetical protein